MCDTLYIAISYGKRWDVKPPNSIIIKRMILGIEFTWKRTVLPLFLSLSLTCNHFRSCTGILGSLVPNYGQPMGNPGDVRNEEQVGSYLFLWLPLETQLRLVVLCDRSHSFPPGGPLDIALQFQIPLTIPLTQAHRW